METKMLTIRSSTDLTPAEEKAFLEAQARSRAAVARAQYEDALALGLAEDSDDAAEVVSHAEEGAVSATGVEDPNDYEAQQDAAGVLPWSPRVDAYEAITEADTIDAGRGFGAIDGVEVAA
jgi:hypothetical protein